MVDRRNAYTVIRIQLTQLYINGQVSFYARGTFLKNVAQIEHKVTI